MEETIQKPNERSLQEIVNDLMEGNDRDLAILELQAKGQDLTSIIKSIGHRANQTGKQLKTEFDYQIKKVRAKKNSAMFSRELPEEDRIKYELTKSRSKKKAESTRLTTETNEKLIPLRNEAAELGKEASQLEKLANDLDLEVVELQKNTKWNLAHNTKIYFGGQLLLGLGDALALYMTLRDAGAGNNFTILLFLPLFGLIMAGLAHCWSDAVIEKDKLRKWVFGSLSLLILLTLMLSRIVHFDLG